MKLKNILELGARLRARFPSMWKYRLHLVAFVPLFLVFFVVNQLLLKLPETLRQTLNASPLAHHIAYTDAAVQIFPPKLEIEDAALVNPALNDEVLRFDKLTIRPELLRLFSGQAAVRVTALAGAGFATLDAATGDSFDFSNSSFTLEMENLPFPILKALEQFNPGIDGAVTALIKGKATWVNMAGLLIPRGRDLEANGRITLDPPRNDLATLTFERFRMDSTDRSCYASLNGRALIDRRNVSNSELNLTVEVKAGPEHATPALLMNDEVRQRLEQGQPLSFALQGTLGNVRMKPVF